MIVHVVDCPRCYKSRWHATGAFNVNRHGLKRAECVCESCSYVFSSGRPEALEAAAAARGPEDEAPFEPPPIAVPQPSLPHARVLQRPREFTAVGSLARDFKKLQAGEEE